MPTNKWKQYNLLKGNSHLKKHLPITKKLNKNSFLEMLGEHKSIIIKPVLGVLGKNIYQISEIDKTEDLYEIHREGLIKKIKGKLGVQGKNIYQESEIDKTEDLYEIHHEGLIKKIKGKHETYSYIESRIKPSRFLVQQKICLVSIDKSPIDFRVMVQRKRQSSKWRITGKFAKVAQRGYIITNVAKEVLCIEDALRQTSLDTELMQEAIRIMNQTAITATSCITSVCPKRRIIGFDFGVDKRGKVWIIEANFKPGISPFKMLENKLMYQTILKYKFGNSKRQGRLRKKK